MFQCVSPPDPYRCRKCPNFQTNFLVQLKTHHTNPDFTTELDKCATCSFETHSKYLMVIHKELSTCAQINRIEEVILPDYATIQAFHHDHCYFELDSVLECSFCSFRTEWEESLQSHIVMEHKMPLNLYCRQQEALEKPRNGIDWLECDHCPFKTKYSIYLIRHEKRHTNAEPPYQRQNYKCEYCPFGTNFEYKFKQHVPKCHEKLHQEWRYCAGCSYRSLSEKKLTDHVRKKHKNPAKKIGQFKCKYCQHVTTKKTYLQKHVERLHGDCPQRTTKRRRKVDMSEECPGRGKWYRIPSKMKWFQCKVCPYRAAMKNDLEVHRIEKHNNEAAKPVGCIYRFKNTEEGQKPDYCECCSYKMYGRGLLKAHIEKMQTKLSFNKV